MMQFDFTSFVLEILNFLVLVWILKRLLYRPVLNMLDTRRQKIADESVQAELLRNEAEALRRNTKHTCWNGKKNAKPISKNWMRN